MKSILELLKDYQDVEEVEIPLDEFEVCETHGEYQSHKELDGKSVCINPMCPLCAAELRVKSIMGKSGVQKRFLSCSLDNYEVTRQDQHDVIKFLRVYSSRFSEAKENGKSFVLSGSVGTGKTHLACAVANEIARKGYIPYFATVSDIVKKVKSTWVKGSDKTEDQVIKEFAQIDLLIIDEVGATAENEHDDRIIFDIINDRYAEQLPTICLTNLDRDRFTERMGERIADRIGHGGNFITMNWDSYRSAAKRGEK